MKNILTNKEILSNIEILKKLQKDNQKGKNSIKIIELMNVNNAIVQKINKERLEFKKLQYLDK